MEFSWSLSVPELFIKNLVSINEMTVFGVISSAYFLVKVMANSKMAQSYFPLQKK